MNQKIIICDIDGTITKVNDRLKYITQQSPKDWDKFYMSCDEDEPNEPIIKLVCDLAFCGNRIIFFSGRKEKSRQKTIHWIRKYFPNWFKCIEVYLRKDNDYRPDTEVKPEFLRIFNEEEINNIVFFIEDRDSMTKKWRELGFTCLQVCNGDY